MNAFSVVKRLAQAAFLAAVLLFTSAPWCDLRAAAPDEEPRLVEVLRSDRPPAEKEAACVQLHRVGTERAVPVLASLLGDPRLSHAARYALESMSSPAAGRALLDALANTSGAERLGIVGSLGVRREVAAVPALARLLALAGDGVPGVAPNADADLAALSLAVAAPLGELPHRDAIAALEMAWSAYAGPLREAVGDGLLRQANRLLAAGDGAEARRLFGLIRDRDEGGSLHLAAFAGVIRASGDDGLPLLISALTGSSESSRQAALRLVSDLPVTGVAQAFATLLPVVPPPIQTALLNGWMQRPEPPSLAVIVPLMPSASPEVRLAAIRALGRVGDHTVVLPLLELAAAAGPEQTAARLALTQAPRDDVAARLIAGLDNPRSEIRVEAARALGERGEKRAIPALLELAGGEDPAVRPAALRALILLVDDRHLAALVGLVSHATDDAPRAEALRALTLAYERLQPSSGSVALRPLMQALAGGSVETRVALLSVCGSLTAEETRAALRSALNGADPEIRAAAVRSMGRTVDLEMLPDLIQLARDDAEEEFRDLATKACVRLVTNPGSPLFTERRIAIFRGLASTPLSLAQKRALLTGLAGGGTLAELEIAASLLADASVAREATAAVLKIAPRTPESAPALAALRRVPVAADDAEVRKEIDLALKSVELRLGYVTSWQGASALPVGGRTAADLLDAPLAPEANWHDFRTPAARARLARWEPLPLATDAKQPMFLRGGDAAVYGAAYAYTWLQSPRPQGARLEIRHDEGIKVWLNGHLVLHGAGPGSLPLAEADRVGVGLESGWNLLVLKIAQPAKRWSFAVQLKGLDGAPLFEVVADPAAGVEP